MVQAKCIVDIVDKSSTLPTIVCVVVTSSYFLLVSVHLRWMGVIVVLESSDHHISTPANHCQL